MRISAEILLNGDKPIIPSDYRRNILSLIKEVINSDPDSAELYEINCGKEAGKIKPFTFLVSFEADETQNRKGIIRLAQPRIKLHVDAGDPVFLKRIYNGMLRLQNDYPLFPELKAKIGPFYCQECTLLRCTGCKLKVTIGQVNLEPHELKGDGSLSC
ncbi:MAG: hypothetical protein ABFD75_08800 [Smithella sp.]